MLKDNNSFTDNSNFTLTSSGKLLNTILIVIEVIYGCEVVELCSPLFNICQCKSYSNVESNTTDENYDYMNTENEKCETEDIKLHNTHEV